MRLRHGLLTCFLMVTFAAAPASAVDLGWNGLEVRGGVLFPADWDTGLTLGVHADLGELVDDLRLYGGLMYATAEESESIEVAPALSNLDGEFTSFLLGAEVRYFFQGDERGWFAGGGPYVHRTETTLKERNFIVFNGDRIAVGASDTESSSTTLGIVGVGGYRFNERFSAEARYDTASVVRSAQVLVAIHF